MRYPFMRCMVIALVMMNLLVFFPASAGNGIIVEGNPVGTDNIGALNPLLCDNPYCRRITDFLFPTFYAVDPATGLLVTAGEGDYGLALDISAPTDSRGAVKLREDLLWSDGQPVTAYDVFYSYLAATSQRINTPYSNLGTMITAARVIDEHTVEFGYEQVNCSIPARMNFPIIPAHVFDPLFRETVDETGASGELDTWFAEWLKMYPPTQFSRLNSHPFNTMPTVTAGMFQFDGRLPGEEIRMATLDGQVAFVYRDIQFGMTETQNFLSGNSNVLLNPPVEQRDNLIADLDVDVTQTMGNTWNYIALNIADPNLPRSAFDGAGKALEQGHHPMFGDVRVRQALQKSIDVNRIIDIALLGYGVPIASSRIPGTWAANDALQPPVYDLDGAKKLLEAAGWVDRNADGVRECWGCLYGDEGRDLYFELLVVNGGGREVAANLIARQLDEAGFYVDTYEIDSGSLLDQLRFQEFDAYMTAEAQTYPTEPDQSALFTRSSDVLYGGRNYGSYTNPEVETLMDEALNLPQCDASARADLYEQAQAVLQEDQPYIWLYAPLDMQVTRGILGAAPYTNRPFWNIQDWIVTS